MLPTDQNNTENTPIIYSGARWLKTLPAIVYSSLGRHQLKKLAKIGAIIGYPDPDNKRGDWIFDRESIDKYRLRQAATPINIQEKLLELKRKVRI
jgi:hypothetical protein